MTVTVKHWCNDTDREQPKYWKETCPDGAFFTKIFTSIGPGIEPGPAQ
jgi:hypothetical protein